MLNCFCCVYKLSKSSIISSRICRHCFSFIACSLFNPLSVARRWRGHTWLPFLTSSLRLKVYTWKRDTDCAKRVWALHAHAECEHSARNPASGPDNSSRTLKKSNCGLNASRLEVRGAQKWLISVIFCQKTTKMNPICARCERPLALRFVIRDIANTHLRTKLQVNTSSLKKLMLIWMWWKAQGKVLAVGKWDLIAYMSGSGRRREMSPTGW